MCMSVTAGSAMLCALAFFFTRAKRGFAEGASGACRCGFVLGKVWYLSFGFGRVWYLNEPLCGGSGLFPALCACTGRVASHGS